MRMYCTCKSDFQDREYGKGIRVFNPCGTPVKKYRCTVCGREVDANLVEKHGKNGSGTTQTAS